uniref:C-type lectin domain-containing protein n=1 Tax=Oncorhynchus mykiss TaxID=8022 RepID=A0A8C7SWX8_ONCMY
MKNYHSKQGSQGGKKWAGLLTCQTILFVLIGLLVSINTNQAAAEPLSNVTQPRETPEEELAALKLDLSTVLRRYSRLRDNYASLAKNCSATVVNFTGCPEGWLHVLVNEKCYYFSNDKMDWPSSRDNCTSMGSHLSILHSKSSHEALEKEASRIGGFNNYFWTTQRSQITSGNRTARSLITMSPVGWKDIHSGGWSPPSSSEEPPLRYTQETVDCENPKSVAVLDTNRCAWHLLQVPRSKTLTFCVLPIQHLNGTCTQPMVNLTSDIAFTWINLDSLCHGTVIQCTVIQK